MVAAAERTHLVALAQLGAFRDVAGLRVRHLAVLFDPLEVGLLAVAALDGPARAARKHFVHLLRAETDSAGAAEAGGNALIEPVGELFLHRGDVLRAHTRMKAPDAAGYVKTHTASRHHPTLVRIEGGHAAD